MYLKTFEKPDFFQNFRDISTKIELKITFYCIFIKKSNNFEKSAQNISRRLWRHEKPFSQFFAYPLGRWIPWRDDLPQ